jgi:hypothetical protein
MTAVITRATTVPDFAAETRVEVAARRMYDAEVALHVARQARVGAWIAAAYRRLHEAILEHTAALSAAPGGGR